MGKLKWNRLETKISKIREDLSYKEEKKKELKTTYNFRFPFGFHKGKELCCVPASNLRKLLSKKEKVSVYLLNFVRLELNRRKKEGNKEKRLEKEAYQIKKKLKSGNKNIELASVFDSRRNWSKISNRIP